VQTTPDDANLVGNVYFAHYFRWQERVRDLWLHRLREQPGLSRRPWEGAEELLCLTDRVDYLREAMPFDRIETELTVRAAGERAVVLEFRHHRLEASGGRTRLAVGKQEVVWVRRNGAAVPAPARLPDALTSPHEVSP
jgi:acyl-CoA thioesterase FadM